MSLVKLLKCHEGIESQVTIKLQPGQSMQAKSSIAHMTRSQAPKKPKILSRYLPIVILRQDARSTEYVRSAFPD